MRKLVWILTGFLVQNYRMLWIVVIFFRLIQKASFSLGQGMVLVVMWSVSWIGL